MKHLLAILFAVVIVAALAVPALAAETKTVDTADNQFAVGSDARQEARVDGDFAALGADTEVSRGVGGDVFTAGQNVTVTDSDKLQNVLAAGANVNIRVKSARNIYAAALDLDVRADGEAQGVYLVGASVTLSGKARDAFIIARSANISGEIAENLNIRSDNIVFNADTAIGGNITIYSKNHPTLPSSIDPAKVTFKAPGAFGRAQNAAGEAARQSVLRRIAVIIGVSGVVAAVAVSLIVNALRGGFFGEKASTLRRRFWSDALFGLAAVIVVPVAAVGLMFTVVGVPVGALLLGVYAVAMYLAPIAAGLVAGRAAMPRLNRYASGAICVGALYALMLVPYLRVPVAVVATLYGFGALLSGARRREKRRVNNLAEV
ncbi:MAG: hypothetical protein LBN00_12405 [Oscillospiraceae bacterium]|jgi:hypothetical protein|nr:hypothetical protein [Oscillospiraceae bacterium]